MTKKLTKHGEDLALIIDKTVLENLGITENTDLYIAVMGDILLIKPKQTNGNVTKKKQHTLEETATSIMNKYESVFKKLAKT